MIYVYNGMLLCELRNGDYYLVDDILTVLKCHQLALVALVVGDKLCCVSIITLLEGEKLCCVM